MLAALLLVLAQWLDYPAKNIPRTKDGRPLLTAKAPKTRDGKPDLSGIWLPDNTPGVKGHERRRAAEILHQHPVRRQRPGRDAHARRRSGVPPERRQPPEG